ncbi:cyclin-J-like [Carassius auratus]|uniref:Cyclin-J-like n=1 Tax=Carassius auratus TaxID=7957 RepID=A0A6P6QJ62_CARAU|nr:cyclin-J-like [Carassius auratus]
MHGEDCAVHAYTWEQLLPCVERLLLAHDSDVKEANKQKCPQPSAQPAQMMYPVQGPSVSLHQYMQRPNTQYMQQSCQPLVVSSQGPATYLTHTASMQVSTAPVHGLTQTQSMDAKVNIPGRAYQMNPLYPCAAPCFDR